MIPRIPTFAGLEGIDLRIQSIQSGLSSNISWLQYSFGRCDSVLKTSEEEIIPVCYVDSKTDPYDMRPWLDDAHNSYAFCDLLDSQDVNYFDNLSLNAFPTWAYDVAWIFVINLNAIGSDWKVARSTARQDILDYFTRKVRMKGIFQIGAVFEKDIEKIFDGYDIEDPLLVLRDNYAAFRVEGTITFKQDC